MRVVAAFVARLILGLILVAFGVNHFVHFIKPPQPTPEGEAFLVALAETGYMVPVWASVEVACGLAILAGLYVPLALVVLTPVLVNIAAYHLLLDPVPRSLGIVALMWVCHGYLVARYSHVFRPLLAARAKISAKPE